jgi:hypothetical protein
MGADLRRKVSLNPSVPKSKKSALIGAICG